MAFCSRVYVIAHQPNTPCMEQQEKITHTEFMISERISAFFPKMSCPFGSTVVAPTYGLWFLFKALIKRIASPFDWLNSLIVAITQQMQFDWWLNLLICCANVDSFSSFEHLHSLSIRVRHSLFRRFFCSLVYQFQLLNDRVLASVLLIHFARDASCFSFYFTNNKLY